MKVCTDVRACQNLLERTFADLRTTPRSEEPPAPMQAFEQCGATYVPPASKNETTVRATINRTYYRHHQPRIRLSGQSYDQPNNPFGEVNQSALEGEVLVLAAFSAFGSTDEQQSDPAKFRTGFPYFSVTRARGAVESPNFSPVRDVNRTMGQFSSTLAHLGDVTRSIADIRTVSIPTPADQGFHADVYWPLWGKTGGKQPVVVFMPSGTVPTQAPAENPGSTPQCELGPWHQVYTYENGPGVMMSTLLEEESFSHTYEAGDSLAFALYETPQRLLQGAISVAKLREHGQVTLVHDALDPRNVVYIWGNNEAAITAAQDNALVTVTLKLERRKPPEPQRTYLQRVENIPPECWGMDSLARRNPMLCPEAW